MLYFTATAGGIREPVADVVAAGGGAGREFGQPCLTGMLDVRDQQRNRPIVAVRQCRGTIESQSARIIERPLLVPCVSFDKGWSGRDVRDERRQKRRGPAPSGQTRPTVARGGGGTQIRQKRVTIGETRRFELEQRMAVAVPRAMICQPLG